jgi:hypothetical protein
MSFDFVPFGHFAQDDKSLFFRSDNELEDGFYECWFSE